MAIDDLVFAITRALHIGCALLLVSLPWFVTFIWRPTARNEPRHETFCRKIIVVLSFLLVVEILTGVAWLGHVAASMTDEPTDRPSAADFERVLAGTRFGMLWQVRAGVALLLGGLLAMGSRRPRRLLSELLLMLGLLLLGSLAWAGHAASGLRWPVWHLIVDWVHLLSGAVWPMGLLPIAIFLAQPRGSPPDEDDVKVVRRYSDWALAAVLALVASGVANSWLMLPSWLALVTSTYGLFLVGKIALVLVMIALGALNRHRFLPALKRGSVPAMMRTLAVESGLAVAVILIVGLMGMIAPEP